MYLECLLYLPVYNMVIHDGLFASQDILPEKNNNNNLKDVNAHHTSQGPLQVDLKCKRSVSLTNDTDWSFWTLAIGRGGLWYW